MKIFAQDEKERYLAELSEDDFREKIVRRLFKRLGFTDGRDLCGPEEQGKDAVFFEVDKFNTRSLVCVQTKKGSITMAADSTKSLADIRAQVRTALEAPFKCVKTKVDIFPSRVYLIASGRINQAARTWITSNAGNDARIIYLDRDDLIDSLDKNCPEIWLNITADVFPYLHAISRLIDDQALIGPTSNSVAGIKSYYAASDRAFVDLRLIKSVSTSRKVSGRFTEKFDFEEADLEYLTSLRGERLLLLAEAGTGKSTLLLRAAYLMAREGAAGKHNYRVPVLLRANEIVKTDLMEAMQSAVDDLVGAPTNAFTADDLEAGRVTLLVDGLDEVAKGDARSAVMDSLNDFYRKYPRCSIVLTTRPYSSIEAIDGVKGFSRARIASMSMKAAEKMLVSYQSGEVDHKHTKEILRRIDGIHGIELNPLLVTVFALSSDAERKDIPANITELFSKFTELMLGRWDESKGISQQHKAKIKAHLVSRFSHSIHSERRTQFSLDEFKLFSEAFLEEINRASDSQVLIKEIVERSGLFREVGGLLEFRHHLIQEYFAGCGIASVNHIHALVADEWWRNPIVFYFGSNPENVNGLLEVATSLTTRANDAALTVGLALQTCYLSRFEERIDVWKWVVEALACSTEIIIRDTENERYPIFNFITHYVASRDAVALSGIEKNDAAAMNWAISGNHFSTAPEIRRFWAFVALIENGRIDLLEGFLAKHPIDEDLLNFALGIGCYLAEKVRSISDDQKTSAGAVRKMLSSKTAVVTHQFAKEYRSQLLEYRQGKIVALDEPEPE